MSLSKEYYTETFWFRIVLAIGAIAIPMFGLIMRHELPHGIEYMSHRYIMSAAWLSLLVLSFTSNFFKERFITITCWYFFILDLWAIWIVYLNDFNINYASGLFISYCATNIVYTRPKLYYTFFTIVIVVAVSSIIVCPAPEISPYVFSFAMILLGIVFMLTFKIIMNAEEKLSELNQTLEKKVLERTMEAENKTKLLALKNKELEQFAYIASHDLKSPLRNIGGFIQLIKRKLKHSENDEIVEYMNYVVGNVNKMEAIIDDILRYSRFGNETMTFSQTNVEAVVQDVCDLLKKEIQARNTIIRSQNLSHHIYCHTKQLTQLFQNLIDNALKYNESPQVIIEIEMKETEREYLFSVKDNGIGIKPEFREKIFKIFQRLHTDQKYPGTGIGLAICKRIVDNHGGDIWVESLPGKGTTFLFTISKDLGYQEPKLEIEAALSALT